MPGKSGIEKLRNTQYFRKVDYYLIVPIFLITVIGLYVLNNVLSDGFEAYPNNFYRQVGAAIVGMAITVATACLSHMTRKAAALQEQSDLTI